MRKSNNLTGIHAEGAVGGNPKRFHDYGSRLDRVQHIAALHLSRSQRGDIENAFRYSVDYILLDPEDRSVHADALFSRPRETSWDWRTRSDHGGKPGQGIALPHGCVPVF